MSPRTLPLLVLTLTLCGCGTERQDSPPAPGSARERLEADVRFLSDDLMEGRGTPGRGLETAALYIETQLRHAGVAPGAGDSYRPSYQMGEYLPSEASVNVRIDGRDVSPRDYVFVNIGRDPARGSMELELVFAGNGIVAEEKDVHDLDGLDVRGKAVIARKGATWPLDSGAVFGWDRAVGKLLAATARGAELLVYVSPELDRESDAEAAFFSQMKNAPVGFVREPAFGPGGLAASALNPVLLISPQALSNALGSEVAALARGPQGKSIRIDIQAPVRESRASNVLGRIEGSDPRLRDEWLVLTAHFDHLGSHPVPAGQDGIWNGADDNASGTAVVLEMARSFSAQRPRRSILVFLTSGEDRGLFGSAFYAANPTVPMDRVVANVNVDMVGRSQGSVQAIADGTPSLFQKAVELGRKHGIEVIPDQQPTWRISYLTDCYHFLRSGVPSVEFFTGLHADYHQPSDTADKIRFDEMARILQLTTELTRHYADGAPRPEFQRPEWFVTP